MGVRAVSELSRTVQLALPLVYLGHRGRTIVITRRSTALGWHRGPRCWRLSSLASLRRRLTTPRQNSRERHR